MYKEKKAKPENLRLTKKEQSEKSRWVLWAELMKRVFAADVCVCRNCGGRMELRAVVIRPPATLKVLKPCLEKAWVEVHLGMNWSRGVRESKWVNFEWDCFF